MKYFVLGITISGSHFWVDNISDEATLDEERDKINSVVAYFGGGSVTIYEVDGADTVSIYSFDKVDGDADIFLDNEDEYW